MLGTYSLLGLACQRFAFMIALLFRYRTILLRECFANSGFSAAGCRITVQIMSRLISYFGLCQNSFR